MQIEEEVDSEKRRYFIVVFGPPASGKSSLARDIYSSFAKECEHQGKQNRSVMVSADCFEEFLRGHSLKELEELSKERGRVQQLNEYRLKRSQFIEQNWKNSRLCIKENLVGWVKENQIVILEDDMLLKSQRKYCRHVAEKEGVLYLELSIDVTLQQCLSNLQNREEIESSQHMLSRSACRQAFEKFQHDQHPYLFKAKPFQRLEWQCIKAMAKMVVIDHPELHVKATVSVENAAKDEVEVKIRKFISEIMRNKQLQNRYFPNQQTKAISAFLGSLKKRYTSKSKTFQGFLQFLKNETESFH